MAPEELFFRLSEARDSWHVSVSCFSLDLEMLLCLGTVFRFCNVLLQSGSADLYHCITDPNPTRFFRGFQDAILFFYS
jgi:hypothetical protein